MEVQGECVGKQDYRGKGRGDAHICNDLALTVAHKCDGVPHLPVEILGLCPFHNLQKTTLHLPFLTLMLCHCQKLSNMSKAIL